MGKLWRAVPATLLWAAFVQISIGQDVVIVKTPDGNSKRSGQILDWKGDRIVMRVGEHDRKIDATSVLEIQTTWPEGLEQARKLISQGQFPAALDQLNQAAASEDRQWVQQIIRAEQIQVHDAMGNHTAATALFLKLAATDPQSRFFYLIPLPWTATDNPPAQPETARWLDSDDSLLKLIGASWQLSGFNRKQAVEVLQQLSENSDVRIAHLAAAQMWRIQSPAANSSDLARWQRQLTRMPTELRAGPLLILAEVQFRLGESEQGKISLMKIPILYPGKKSLMAIALYRCYSKMREQNDEHAAIILQELKSTFPDSPYADTLGNAEQTGP